MWIRSQDRESLTKVNTLRMYYLINQGYGIFTNNHISPNDRMCLGYYSSKKKTMLVLTMIEEHIEYCDKEGYDRVFKMPQDYEV